MKKATQRIAFIVVSTAVFIGCKTHYPESSSVIGDLTPAVFDIDSAWVQGDSLYATVSYGGGCGEHEFTLESAGFLLKSLPPKQPLRIIHRSDGDPCRALIKEEISLDLQSYRGTPRGVTVLIIENWNKNLSYSYE